MLQVSLTKIPQLSSVVIKQKGGHLFIAAPDSLIIDKDGLMELIEALVRIDFISNNDLADTMIKVSAERHTSED